MEEIEIVPYERPMAQALWRVETACFSDPWRQEDFLSAAETAGQVFFVARTTADAAVIGFGGLWKILEEAEILNLAVLPEWRRHGIGRRLMEALCGYADREGVIRLFLEVRAFNEAAKSLYRTLGFTPYGVRAGYYKNPREDAVLMRRDAMRPADFDGTGKG